MKDRKNIIENLFNRYPEMDYLKVDETIECLVNCYKNNNKVLVCGNGGSAADSLHIVGELMKSFLIKREMRDEYKKKLYALFPDDAEYFIENLDEGISAISLVSEVSLITAFSNDNASDLVYAQQVLGHGKSGDVLVAISTSGNSENVIYAAKIAKVLGLKVIALTGYKGGILKNYADMTLNVPSNETYIIQEYHLPLYHTICAALENEIFGKE